MTPPSPFSEKHSHFPSILPPPTDATIQRAQEALVAARSPVVKGTIENALNDAEATSQGKPDNHHHLRGDLRRLSIRLLVRALFRVRVEYRERFPSQPAILAANHLGHIDPFLLLSEIPADPYYYLLGDARSLYNKAWKRLLLRIAGGTIPLQRIWKEEIAVMQGAKAGKQSLQALATAIAQDVPTGTSISDLRRLDRIVQGLLGEGYGLIIFPEGRLGSKEGHLCLPLKRGTLIYGLRSGMPIVPVGIIGTNNLYLGKELTVRFGQPLRFPQTQHPKPKEIKAVSQALEAAMQDLLPQHYHQPNEIKLFSHFLNHMLW